MAAAHKILVTYSPYAQATLDAAYAASLAQIPDGKAKTAGSTLGRRPLLPASPPPQLAA